MLLNGTPDYATFKVVVIFNSFYAAMVISTINTKELMVVTLVWVGAAPAVGSLVGSLVVSHLLGAWYGHPDLTGTAG